jgi:subtilisin family serine protease
MDEQEYDHIKALRARELATRGDLSPVTRSGKAFRRPGELLVRADVEKSLSDRLSDLEGRSFELTHSDNWRNQIGLPGEREKLAELLETGDLRLWTFPEPPGTDTLPDVLDELRGCAGDPRAVHVNHVFFGEAGGKVPYPIYQGGPGGEPRPAPRPDLPTGSPSDGRVDLAVLDTGLPESWATWHPGLVGFSVPDFDNRNVLYSDGSTAVLATEAGHGLFIGGLVHRLYPGLVMDPGRVLDPMGTGDDVSISAELSQTMAPVISLSLGGYTVDDQAPAALTEALARLGPDRVVVAAAGNAGSDRPFWPAALDSVVAVAAYDSVADRRAEFSNHGPWVDVCAPGCDLYSTYVRGVWPAHDGPRQFELGATWSGTSFAAPLVAAEIAQRIRATGVSGPQAVRELLAGLPDSGWPGFGRKYLPPVTPTLPTR